MFAVGKLVWPLLDPLGAGLILLALGVVALLLRRRRAGLTLAALAFIELYALSTPAVSNGLVGLLEHQYEPVPLTASPSADVIVLLGGGTQAALPPRQDPHLTHGDRLMHAADLFKAGKAPVLLASGGNWRNPSQGGSEAGDMRTILEKFGVPEAAIVLENGSEDTADNARLSAALMRQRGWRTALLVTSGIHMPRAVAVFRQAGVDVIPSATDEIDAPSPDWPALAWLPDAAALGNSGDALHEIVGLLYYRWRGLA